MKLTYRLNERKCKRKCKPKGKEPNKPPWLCGCVQWWGCMLKNSSSLQWIGTFKGVKHGVWGEYGFFHGKGEFWWFFLQRDIINFYESWLWIVKGEVFIYRPRLWGWRARMQGWRNDEGGLGYKEGGALGLCFLKSIALWKVSQGDWMWGDGQSGESKGVMREEECGRGM